MHQPLLPLSLHSITHALLVTACILTCQVGLSAPPETIIEFRLAQNTQNDIYSEPVTTPDGKTLYMTTTPVVTNTDFSSARRISLDDGLAALQFELTPTGTESMTRATQQHQGKPLAILINGKLESAPLLNSVITSSGELNGHFTTAEIDQLVKALGFNSEEPDSHAGMIVALLTITLIATFSFMLLKKNLNLSHQNCNT